MDLHACIHERDWDKFQNSMETFERKFDSFLQKYYEESKSVSSTLSAMTQINEQTASLFSTLQNTIHGPNRDNGIVKTAIETKTLVDVVDKRVSSNKVESDVVEKRVTALEHSYIRVTITVSILISILIQISAIIGPILIKKLIGG